MHSNVPTLTARQQAYAQHRAEGKAPVLAAVEAGYVSAYLASYRAERLPIVQQEIERLRALQPPPPPTDSAITPPDKAEACSDLWAMSKNERALQSARVQALKLLADMMGWTEQRGPLVGLVVNLGASERNL